MPLKMSYYYEDDDGLFCLDGDIAKMSPRAQRIIRSLLENEMVKREPEGPGTCPTCGATDHLCPGCGQCGGCC